MLYPEYLNTLSIGTHTLTFIYNTGSVEASFSILDGMDEVPKTGEDSMIVCIFLVMYKCQVKIPRFCAVKIPHFYSDLIYP